MVRKQRASAPSQTGMMLFLLFFGIVSLTALTLRIHPLFSPHVSGDRERAVVEKYVRSTMVKSLEDRIRDQNTQLSDEKISDKAEREAQSIIEGEQERFKAAVARVLEQSKKPGRDDSELYLLGSDSYYFYYLTQKIVKTGNVSDKWKHGYFFDAYKQAPNGKWVAFNAHPYVGACFYQVARLFTKASMMKILSFFPLLFVIPTAFGVVLFLKNSGFSLTASLFATLCLMLAPVYLQRSMLGWYDTDPYTLLFFPFVLYFFARGLTAHPMREGITSGVLTAIYSLFWSGWYYLCLALLISWPLLRFLSRDLTAPEKKGMRELYLCYGVITIFFTVGFHSWQGVLDGFKVGLSGIFQFSLSGNNNWPNVFLTVGETQAVNLSRFVHLTGNGLLFPVAFAGLGYAFFLAFQSTRRHVRRTLLLMLPVSVGAFILAFKVERFTLLAVLPMAFLTASGFDLLLLLFKKAAEFVKKYSTALSVLIKAASLVVLVLCILPSIVLARALAVQTEPLMNDGWTQAAKAIRSETEPDAIIHSWWPAGYYIMALADRAVVTDGGTQNLPETYWIARFFMAREEAEALGILRMLHSGGNEAVEYLLSRGWAISRAIGLINRVVLLNKEDARKLIGSFMGDDATQVLLSKTHGMAEFRPSYILVYDRMVKSNLSLSLMAKWNFRRSALSRNEHETSIFAPLRSGWASSAENQINSSQVLKYRKEAGVHSVRDHTMYFLNGLEVDSAKKSAWINVPGKELIGQPEALYFVENGKLHKRWAEKDPLDVSALIYMDGDDLMSVLADKQLIESILFKMFYLNAETLKFVKPLQGFSDPATETRMFLYKIDWPGFLSSQREAGKEE